MKMQKNERGITLVALVVTIVVLLILAGVTIMYVMSDNGIFGKAQDAKNETDLAVVREIVMNAFWEAQAEYYDPRDGREVTDASTAQTYINSKIAAAGLTSTMTFTSFCDSTNGSVGTGTVTYNKVSYTVDLNTKNTTSGILTVTKGTATTEP